MVTTKKIVIDYTQKQMRRDLKIFHYKKETRKQKKTLM